MRPTAGRMNSGPRHAWLQVILRHFKIGFHHDHVGRFLRQRLGWTPQKPKTPRQRSAMRKAILDWQSQTFPADC